MMMVSLAIPIYAQTTKQDDTSSSSKQKEVKQRKSSTKIERGRRLFGTHCASCHADLENSVKPGKPIRSSQVLSTMATFKSYLDKPLGDMPHYEHVIADDKLLSDLYAYVKSEESKPSSVKGTEK